MIVAAKSCDVARAAVRLRADPAAAVWMDRRDLARAAAEAIANSENAEDAAVLLGCLACDAKWEVRLEVAERLLVLPDSDFARLANQLAEDANAFVRRAAEQALDERRRASRTLRERQREEERLARELHQLEAEIGRPIMERMLRIFQHQNEHFVGAVVHDLRGTLTSLKSSCLAVLAEAKPSRKATRLRDNLTLIENIVNDMDAFTRPAPLERRRERLRNAVIEAVEVARENVRKNGMDVTGVAVEVEVNEAIRLPIAKHLIVMALTNVIKNAYEAFGTGNDQLKGGTITIRSEACDGFIRLVIADNGQGMPDEELAAVTAFRPGRRSPFKRYSTGYGLPIAVRNVAAHGGALAIDSREDTGTAVTITLPLTCNDEENHHERTGTGRRRRSAHRRRNRRRA